MSRSRFESCMEFILKWEGERFTDHPADRGGPTRYGVIQVRYDEYRKSKGLELRSVRHIEQAEVWEIYRKLYWDAIDADAIPAPLDLALFNVAVNSGVGRARAFRKELFGIFPSENIRGDVTSGNPFDMARAVCDRYERFYRAIVRNNPSQRVFLRGWLNRLNDCRDWIEDYTPTPFWTLILSGVDAIYTPEIIAKVDDDNRPYVPVRAFVNALFPEGDAFRKLTWVVESGKDFLYIGSLRYNGVYYLKDGHTYCRLRDLCSLLGMGLTIEEKTITVLLNRGGGKTEIGV